MGIIEALKNVFSADGIEVPGLSDDPFVRGKLRRLQIVARGKFTTLYRFEAHGRRFALKTLTGIHHRDTLESLQEKAPVLEALGYPAVFSINREHSYYIMEWVPGRPVFDSLIRYRHKRPRHEMREQALRSLLETTAALHRRGWLLNDLSWRNFVLAGKQIRPVDPDRIRSILEEARYLTDLEGRDIYTTPLFLSLAQCLNRVPSPADEMQGIALMIDCLYNRDYLIGNYLEARGLEFSRRNQALMLSSGFYPKSRQDRLPERLREPVARILAHQDRSVSAAELLSRL